MGGHGVTRPAAARRPPRRLLFVTGTRADYGKLEPLAVAARADGHAVTFFVTGMHMMARYGLTKEEVHAAGRFDVVEFANQRHGDPQDVVLAKTVVGFSDHIQEARPDLVVIHGDRVEALACSLVCAMGYVRCAHVEGGEVSGTIDEMFRHCNSKLAWTHLVSSPEAARRVRRLGEDAGAIHVIGSPELDLHARPSGVTLDAVRAPLRGPDRRLRHLRVPPRHLRGRDDRRAGRRALRRARRLGPVLRGDPAQQRPRRRPHRRRHRAAALGPLPRAAVDAVPLLFRS